MPPGKGKGKGKGKKTQRKSKAEAKGTEEPQEMAEMNPVVVSNVEEASGEVVDKVKEVVKDVAIEPLKEVVNSTREFVGEMNGGNELTQMGEEVLANGVEAVKDVALAAGEFVDKLGNDTQTKTALTPEERKKKMEELRKRMRESAQANRTAVIKEATVHKITFRDQARLEKQKQLAETLRSQVQAEEEGQEDDIERGKNWTYTIEENDAWEKRMKRKKGRADFEFHDYEDQARKKYKKDLDHLKPDLIAYNKQKEAALGLAPGTLVKTSEEGKRVATTPTSQQLAAADLYRDANSLLYADNKPSEEAIDRVVAKLNKDMDKRNTFSRKRNTDSDTELITYINEKNRIFNKKIARYYDKYTEEIRASFERGTAL